jgi:7-carboxy-7-deazaguanine synthase
LASRSNRRGVATTEPLLQLDRKIVDLCHAAGFSVAVETNGTIAPTFPVDWLTVSPKARAALAIRRADELKVVFPQEVPPDTYDHVQAAHRFLQPMDGPNLDVNTTATAAYCLGDPRWRLSLQIHKIVGIR